MTLVMNRSVIAVCEMSSLDGRLYLGSKCSNRLRNQLFSMTGDDCSSHPSLIFAVAAEVTRRNGSYLSLLKLFSIFSGVAGSN